MGNADSSFTPTSGSASRKNRVVEPASARGWWRTRGQNHAHRRHHASSCGFESLGGLGHQDEGRACSKGAKSYWCELPLGGDDDVFLDMGQCSARFSAHTSASSSSLPAGDAAGHASCSSSARTEDSGLGDSLILQAEGAEAVEGTWSRLPSVASSGSGSGSGVPPFRSDRKDYLKRRIRQLGDWTGSLSRKKRRVQVR